MTRPPQPCYKVPWETLDLAEGHRLLLIASGRTADPARLRAYHCCYCLRWHVGNDRRKQPRDEGGS